MTAKRECVNTWDQLRMAGGDQIAISYQPRDSRSVQPAKYAVWRIKDGRALKTDPQAAWYDRGLKTFSCFTNHEAKAEALAQAMAWADATYGKRDWVRNRLGDYLDRTVNARFPLRSVRKQPQEGPT